MQAVRIALTACLVSLFAVSWAHADDVVKERLARELMTLTGSAELGKLVMDGMMQQFALNPQIPKEFIDKFMELAKPEEIIEMVVPIYVRTYDEATLQAAVTFYKTEEGRKLVAALPAITQESMALGQQWGLKLAEQTQQALLAGK